LTTGCKTNNECLTETALLVVTSVHQIIVFLHVAEWAFLGTGHSLALLVTWATLAKITAVNVRLEAKRAF
jgi:hypothetical protein